MVMHQVIRLGLGAILLALWFTADAKSAEPDTLRIGLSKDLFRHLKEDTIQDGIKSLQEMVKKETGYRGEITIEKDRQKLAEQLKEGRMHLGVFSGYELAWLRESDSHYLPLIVAVNEHRLQYANLLVPKKSTAKSVKDLKGKTLILPASLRPHCKVFLDRTCQGLGQEPKAFFGKIKEAANFEDAIDDVVDELGDAVLVDSLSVDSFKRRKPGRFARVRLLQKSAAFPATALVHYQGKLKEETIKKFKAGMLKTNKTPDGKRLLTLWKLTAFQTIPADYEKTLAGCAKAYPATGK